MQHITLLLMIIILLVAGFFTLTAVLMVMTEDPTKFEGNHREDVLKKEYRQKFYKFDSRPEEEPRYFTLRTASSKARARFNSLAPSTSTEVTTIMTSNPEYKTILPVSTHRPMRVSPVTIKVNQSIFHEVERMETESAQDKVETQKLRLIREIKMSQNEKISTLRLHNSLLYLALTDGEIPAYNTTTYEVVKSYKTSLAIRHMGFLGETIVVTEKSTLSVLDDEGRVQKQLKLPYESKNMQVFENQIYVLSKSNEDIFVYDEALKLRNSLHFTNEIQETCNFILPTAERIYVSCQSSILQLSSNGHVDKKLTTSDGSYSLGIDIHDNAIFAVKRGKEEIHVFDESNGNLKSKLVNSAQASAIWSSIAISSNKLFVLEYITNVVKVFLLP